ncbi:MAG: alanine/glycine:cation symporter family protein [Pseudomonadota bacterium]
MAQAQVDPALELVTNIADFIWAGTWGGDAILSIAGEPFPPMAIILLGGGLFMMARLKFYPIVNLGAAIAGLFKSRKGEGEGEISPFAALSTALSGQVGTGNLAGVASAIALGGPGAVFWMWITALIGMALAFSEGALAIRYREKTSEGAYRGGPMSYIMLGLGPKWTWLAVVFCIVLLFSALVTGNAIQANAVADGLKGLFGVTEIVGGAIVAIAVFVVIIGGIKSIGSVAEKVIPFMAGLYIILAITVLAINAAALPDTLSLIFYSAFNPSAAAGGFAGALMILAIRAGVARGLFSNEAGQGSTPIAHAVAQTNDPEQQGQMAMLGTFIDTIVVCTMTALVILTVQGSFVVGGTENSTEVVAYSWQTNMEPFAMTAGSFGTALPFEIGGIPLGSLIVSLVLILFVFTTLLTWSYYGERAITFLYARLPGSSEKGEKALHLGWRVTWCLVIVAGASQASDFVWRLGDIANAAMTLPNLLALLLLSGVVVKLAGGERKAGTEHSASGKAEPAE